MNCLTKSIQRVPPLILSFTQIDSSSEKSALYPAAGLFLITNADLYLKFGTKRFFIFSVNEVTKHACEVDSGPLPPLLNLAFSCASSCTWANHNGSPSVEVRRFGGRGGSVETSSSLFMTAAPLLSMDWSFMLLVLSLFVVVVVERFGLVVFDGCCSLDGVPVRQREYFSWTLF